MAKKRKASQSSSGGSPKAKKTKTSFEKDPNENPSVSLFRDYLRIKTVHPTPEYKKCVQFLVKIATEYKLEHKTVEIHKGKPIVIMTLPGTDTSLKSILLVSHTDVVPVDETKWNHPPFDAVKDENGNIYARGTQDMKSVGIQYLEAIKKLVDSGAKFLRTIHLVFMPDEEIGGTKGMQAFVEHEEFKKLNVEVALDEGIASPNDVFTVFYGERAAWWVQITATGPVGHGSRFIENTANEKLITVINKFLQHRKEQFEKLHKGMSQCGMKLGDVTTINLTALKSGVTTDNETFFLNVIPSKAMAGFDVRIPPSVNLEEFKKQLDEWTNIEGVSYQIISGLMQNTSTPISDDSKWWNIFKHTCTQMSIKIDPQIFPAATDSRFIRNLNIPAFGFSPMNNTPVLLHDHNEFVNEKVFLKGIEIYCGIIPALANTKND